MSSSLQKPATIRLGLLNLVTGVDRHFQSVFVVVIKKLHGSRFLWPDYEMLAGCLQCLQRASVHYELSRRA